MAKTEKPLVNTNIKTEGDNSHVHFHLGDNKTTGRKGEKKKSNWIVKTIVVAVIGLICSIILIYVKNSTATNGKPAYIQGGSAPIEKDK